MTNTGPISVNRPIKFGGSGPVNVGGGNVGGGGGGGTPGTPQPLVLNGFTIAVPTTMSFGSLGGIYATGGLGAYMYSINQSNITDITYELNSTTGSMVFYSGQGPWTAGRQDVFTCTVTDASGATASVTCIVNFQTAPCIIPGGPLYFYNSQSTASGVTFNGFQTQGPGLSSSDVTITDPTGNFSGTDYLYCHNSTWPTPGNYPLTCTAPLTAGGVITANYTLALLNDPGPSFVQWQPAGTLYSSRVAGTVVGQALTDGSALTTIYALSNNANGAFSINGLTGVVSVAGALTAQTYGIVIVAVREGLSFSQAISIPVSAGNTLAASAMTATVNQSLTNYQYQPDQNIRTVITPTKPSGITGTPVWSITDQLRCPIDEDPTQGHGYARYEINSSTGLVTTRAQLSAQTDSVSLSVTDGINTCTQTFSVPVAAVASSTVICVGQGMSTNYAANGGTMGFEHWANCSGLFQGINPYPGCTIKIFSNSNINYYANDLGNGLDPNQGANYSLRFGLHGPLNIVGVQGTGGARPRLGGIVGSGVGGNGMGIDAKGFFTLSDADISISNIEFSDIHANGWQGGSSPESNSTGCAIRQNGNIWGNLTVNNCYFHDCDQGIETGFVPCIVRITNTEINNSGGVYVSSGATHNVYVGGCAHLYVDNILSWRSLNGHEWKSRAYAATITNSRFYDTERGAASCQFEIPDGGAYTFDNCVFHKGPQPQNPFSLQCFAEMTHPQTVCSVDVSNSTFINACPTGIGVDAFYIHGQCMVTNGSLAVGTSTNNKFANYPAGTYEVQQFNASAGANVTGFNVNNVPQAITVTNHTILSAVPALDLTNPQTGSLSPRPGPMYVIYDGENRNNWQFFFNYEIDPGSDDIRVSASGSPVGTVLFTPQVHPALYTTEAPSYVNPFATGSIAWTLRQDAGAYTGGLYGVAAPGKYNINGTTGAISVGTAGAAGTVDNIIIRAVASDGTTVQTGFLIVWVA